MKTLTLKLPEEQAALLERKARALGRPKSALAREAVLEMLASGPSRSCHDLMKARCGAWKNSPRDLATNKKYLEGFGQ
jgi:hypothetical protein